jgi:hypothetical protein
MDTLKAISLCLFYDVVSTADILNIQGMSRTVIWGRPSISGLSPRKAGFGSRRFCVTHDAQGGTLTGCFASASNSPSVSQQRCIFIYLQTADHDVTGMEA